MNEAITPEEAGVSSAGLNKVHAALQGFVDQGKYAGITTLIARRGQVVYVQSYGHLDLARKKPLRPNSLFRIYSLTKPVTTVAVLLLYEAGLLELHDPVARWIPAFKHLKVLQNRSRAGLGLYELHQDITVWHLLTHTAGLCYGYSRHTPAERFYHDAQLVSPIVTLQMPLVELVQKLSELPLAHQPGTLWRYSLAQDVLGYLIEVIAGKPFDVFLRERIFEPLGMGETAFFVPQDKLDRFGPMYGAPRADGLPVVDHVEASPFVRADAVPSGGAGLISTMPDYFRFLTMVANGGVFNGIRLLKQSTLDQMTTNHLHGAAFPVRFDDQGQWPKMGYGLGVGVRVADGPQDRGPDGVFGWGGASGTDAWIYPNEQLIVLTMTQAWFQWEARDTLRKLAYAALAR